ncbi:hypothetical protein V6N12_062503 [Hibiscus sabdariffa]|uniref:DUF4283 domain-containing protein n=1 Tax=Hibiscus sabdariffa TaxID=183260 RepID=A0ABR2F911_9ROSI
MIGVFEAAADKPSNPRKHRRFDKEPPDRGGPGNRPTQMDVVVDADGEVIRSTVDGLISIEILDRIQKLAAKSFDQTLVIKLLGRRIGYTTLQNKLLDLWKPQHAFKLMDIDNDYFLVTFKAHSDFLHVLADGPWMMFGHYLTSLPATLYKRSLITAIGECIGPVVKIDYQTDSGRRGRFACLAIKVDLRKPLVSKIIINGIVQLIEYESLPLQPTDQDVSVDAESVAIVTSKTAVDKSLYGPWMVVEPLPRRVPRKQAENNVKGKSVVISKPSSGTHVRNPLTLSDFPILSRNFHKGGSSKSVPPQVVSLDASKHYVVVINENSDLNVQQPMQQASDPPHMQHHLLGEPPDLN